VIAFSLLTLPVIRHRQIRRDDHIQIENTSIVLASP